MTEEVLSIADDFWNIRGEFKIAGMINIGTHASLVRGTDDQFVMLDAYTLRGEVKKKVDQLTDNGKRLKAIVNLHPFHTMHVETAHNQYPNAKLYGTQRHIERFASLPWQMERCESAEFAALFADDFDFSVPSGVDFISRNEQIHCSSVLAYHRESKTIHVDDTLMYLKPPGVLGWIFKPEVKFHMTLANALEKRPGAADEFLAWGTQLVKDWHDAENLCAAHSSILVGPENKGESIANRILSALENVASTLKKHKKKYG